MLPRFFGRGFLPDLHVAILRMRLGSLSRCCTLCYPRMATLVIDPAFGWVGES